MLDIQEAWDDDLLLDMMESMIVSSNRVSKNRGIIDPLWYVLNRPEYVLSGTEMRTDMPVLAAEVKRRPLGYPHTVY